MSEAIQKEKQIAFPEKLMYPLFQAKERIIVLYGGRAGTKSWGISGSLVIRAAREPIRVLCAREFKSSTKDSIWELLSDQIQRYGLRDFFKIEESGIYGKNGSQFKLIGVRNNPTAVKSAEGVDVLWLEEAANISQYSYDVLEPTIRKDGSKIYISFNPELESDFIYKFFVKNTPPDCFVQKITYLDNPWFPESLRPQLEYMKRTDPDRFNNIWMGEPRAFLDNAVYANELRVMTTEGRIRHVPYDPLTPVHTFWDLGYRDSTAIILAQKVGFEFHVIDFVVDNAKSIIDYLSILQKKPYVYGIDHLPHDAAAKSLATGRSIQQVLIANGRKVKILPNLQIRDGIEAARLMFPNIYIDERKCELLVQSLRNYVWDIRDDVEANVGSRGRINRKPVPLHDSASHAADAFRYMALALKGESLSVKPPDPFADYSWSGTTGSSRWMA